MPAVADSLEIQTSYRARLFDAEAGDAIYETEFEHSRNVELKAYCAEGVAELHKKELDALVDHILPKAEAK